MNQMLPIIEELANAPYGSAGDAERARWLLCCPISILLTYQFAVINQLRSGGFQAGVSYVEAECACMRQNRRDGLMVHENPWRLRMMAIFLAGGGAA